jgi:hypothetical protein
VALLVFEFALYAMVLFYLTKVADIAARFGSLSAFLSDGWNLLDLLNVVSGYVLGSQRGEWLWSRVSTW